ncbi:pyruvate, phosphate dikinase [Roseobacter sp. HKCCD9010]|uniref:putative PEP-binding protein n=1 Tax=unclassified Roseobacter TaxID=196798 RepID=UPI0014916450|nr:MULTISPECIES: putative PEP-binding protein [unclassified Roseobacter]MBF9049555.1 pyruvate, phosphate dikinase [Rhodobacterales bacterium HKCCD4356]NNV11555.1 pyruvate, phosphate dikinase [Roseobacter sp. HKCCD7357]NNV15739.1 pyruvate, phosphate dikinase [Roseobacter sp. HKCCD8768]NNV25199.1 pyruvate, phosphate dikinase [Roseobacter sp. HKCCD8192]NNV29456.1 pyruvate, phosphate dikinase [Roseobacter sp. HKCCD9061]
MLTTPDFTEITPTADIKATRHGSRAKCLQRLVRLDLPVPLSVALPFDTVRSIAKGKLPNMQALMGVFGDGALVSVRSSSQAADWGGPGTVLNIGMNDAVAARLAETHGQDAADALYLSFIKAYAVDVLRLDEDIFDEPITPRLAKSYFEDETEEPFPQDPGVQLTEVLRSMARAWEGTTARLLRQAQGAPADAGLGLVVQQMALGIGQGISGSGVMQFVSAQTGKPQVTGRYLPQGQGRAALDEQNAQFVESDARGPALEDACPKPVAALREAGALIRTRLREELQIEFTLMNGELFILDAVRCPRSGQAEVAIAVALAEDGVISKSEAMLRIPPFTLNQLLHRQVNPEAPRDVLTRGIAAAPGAATGKIVFTSEAAQAAAAQGDACILVRRDTSPEDIRGMHAAQAILTERGGMTSHAAVIARGLGLPCVSGATRLQLNSRKKTLTVPGRKVFHEGDVITVDGSSGEVLAGTAEMIEPALGGAFATLMKWADEARDIGIRANADTREDAEAAQRFGVDGIGLCRTEHMFFDPIRLTVMREMIFAEEPGDRTAALDRLLPMQRKDFTELFKLMQGQPVCIRLFDPPLHEFLPTERDGIRAMAEAMDMSVSRVASRIESMQEFNPMLGMRGVRLGITVPEIYDMQARAIFEATIAASDGDAPVVPEIMIPLVSARREVELVKARVDAVAAAVRAETGVAFDYRLGVMVETPRAALRAGEIAESSAFLSFGTNDLTQMTYGLSRDDAGRFMSAYVHQGVFPEDPFQRLDTDGVGELLLLGAERGRAARPELVLSLCGEHGGHPDSIAFSRTAGFDYVSCSPFRVPVAKLAAAQLSVQDKELP